MQATTLLPRTTDLFTQGLERQTGAALLRFGAAPPPPDGRISWSGDGAVAWLDEPRGHVWSVGEPTAAAGLVLRAAHQLPETVREFTGPRGTEALLGRHLPVRDQIPWIFRWTLAEPPVHPA